MKELNRTNFEYYEKKYPLNSKTNYKGNSNRLMQNISALTKEKANLLKENLTLKKQIFYNEIEKNELKNSEIKQSEILSQNLSSKNVFNNEKIDYKIARSSSQIYSSRNLNNNKNEHPQIINSPEKKQLLIEIKEKDKKMETMENNINLLKNQIEELTKIKLEKEKIIAEQNTKLEKNFINPNSTNSSFVSSKNNQQTEEEIEKKYSKLLIESKELKQKLKNQENVYNKKLKEEIEKNNKLNKEIFDMQINNKVLTTDGSFTKINSDGEFKNLFKFTFKNYEPIDEDEKMAFKKMEEYLGQSNDFDLVSESSRKGSCNHDNDKIKKNILNN